MAKLKPGHLAPWMLERASSIWLNMMTNNLWQRMLKNTLATTVAVIIAMNPSVVAVYGKAAYLAPITTVFGHPGRRFGMMAEALVLAVSGTLLGMAWSVLGLYLSSLIYPTNAPAAYTIRGLFLAVALLFHGFLRSNTPRLFIMVLLTIIVSVVSLTSTAVSVTKLLVTQILYPILTAVAILLVVNMCVFPEFSSGFLGNTTIETLDLTTDTLRDAGRYFLQSIEPPTEEDSTETKTGEDKERSEAEVEAMKMDPEPLYSFLHPLKWYEKLGKAKTAIVGAPPAATKAVKLKSLTDAKAKLRQKLGSIKSIQQECNFELAFAVLPPRDLKPISVSEITKLVANTLALIGACESKYALMGDQSSVITTQNSHNAAEDSDENSSSDESTFSQGVTSGEDESGNEDKRFNRKRKKNTRKRKTLEENLELVKPIKEIESGDIELLNFLLKRITDPLRDLQEKMDRSTDVINSCMAYAYDVPKLPSGVKAPAGIRLEELDIRCDIMKQGIAEFDRSSASALESAVVIRDPRGAHMDLMPRMETFLISSFILNQRSAALHILEMLKHSRNLVEKRLERRGRRRLYAPKINWRKWLTSGGEEDLLTLPPNARKDVRTGKQKANKEDDEDVSSATSTLVEHLDEESGPAPREHDPQQIMIHADIDGSVDTLSSADKSRTEIKKDAGISWLRNKLADLIEYVYGSEDVAYAFKLTIAVFLVTWPAFVADWNHWYSLNRGLWAALQLVLITEVAVGTSVMTFVIRGVGTTVGCIWGWAAFEASRGNRAVCIVILVIGIVPSTYIQLGSKYIKAGMVSIISMCVVALATIDQTVPGSGTENFLKRLLAFLIGGVVALVVEMVLYPVKARTRLVESLASAINQISRMEACLAHGVESDKKVEFSSPAIRRRFEEAKQRAEGSLTAAETFLPFCANEPRLKGSFKGLALIYQEMLYVLHQIVEKMDNMLSLRGEYGSSALEEFHSEVYPYRRNVAGSITLILFAVHEALTTKLPLPQFIPSARLAHLRMVNRVRSLLVTQKQTVSADNVDRLLAKRLVRQKFVAFQAASAGQIEVIEYLEELQDLTKLLVGSNEFRSGLLTRPTYREYLSRITRTLSSPQSPGLDANSSPKPVVEPKLPANIDSISTRMSPQEDHADEIRDTLPDPMTLPTGPARRRSTFKLPEGLARMKTWDKEEESMKEMDEDELPRSLQRVRSRRIEERNAGLEKMRSRKEEEEAWVAGREKRE